MTGVFETCRFRKDSFVVLMEPGARNGFSPKRANAKEGTLRFLTITKGKENGAMPPPEMIEAVEKLADQATKDGTLVMRGGLYPSAAGGAKVLILKGQLQVLDGPFTEAKEVIGGFAIFEYGSREQALAAAKSFVELSRRHWPEWEGEIEIRQMWSPDDDFPQAND